MAQAWSGSRRLVFFVAPLLLAAQEKTKWEADFQEGADAFAAGNYSQSIESLTAALQDEQAFAPLDLRRADTAHLLAMSYQFLGRFDRAEPLYLEAQRINESNGPAGRDRLGITLDGLGQLRFEQERWKDAEDLERRAIALCGEMRGERDSCTLVAKRHLGEIYSVSGRFREAETILQQVINTARQNTSLAPQLLPVALRDEALIDVANGHYRQAELLLKEALDLSTKLGAERSEVADSLLALARLYRAEKDTGRSEPLLKRAAGIYEKNNDPCLAHALQEIGLIAITQGKYAIAKQHLLQTISIYEKYLGPNHINIAFAQVGLAEAYLGERNYPEAHSMIERALAKESAILDDSHPELAFAHMTAARISEAQKLSAEADTHYRQALDIYRRTTTGDNYALVMAERQYERFSKSFRK